MHQAGLILTLNPKNLHPETLNPKPGVLFAFGSQGPEQDCFEALSISKQSSMISRVTGWVNCECPL